MLSQTARVAALRIILGILHLCRKAVLELVGREMLRAYFVRLPLGACVDCIGGVVDEVTIGNDCALVL